MINQDEKSKEYFFTYTSSLLEEVQREIMKEVKIYKAKIEKLESDKALLQK